MRNKKGYQQQQAKSSQLLDYVFENNWSLLSDKHYLPLLYYIKTRALCTLVNRIIFEYTV